MQRRILIPNGWPGTLEEIPPGPFFNLKWLDTLMFKSEYSNVNGYPIAYNEAGEYYCGDSKDMLQPVRLELEER